MWTPSDVVLNQPLRVQRPQDTKHVHVSVGIENVVNHTLGRKRNMTVRTDLGSGNLNSTGCSLRVTGRHTALELGKSMRTPLRVQSTASVFVKSLARARSEA